MTETLIKARGVGKRYNGFTALHDVNIDIPVGRIIGLIGANGAGKTTLLNAILGLASYDGELEVLGLDPSKDRGELMKQVCFIADVATLPKWMTAGQVVDYVASVHPRFHREKAMDYLARTSIPMDRKVKALSKGMIVQLHLAVVMAIDAKLLVLDEPTLGLDILFRKKFYQNLLEDYFDEERTILITTHQVEEVEHILSDVIFIKGGEIVLSAEMDELTSTYTELMVAPGKEEEARAMGPIRTGTSFGRTTCVYVNKDRETLAKLGETRRLGLADIFVVTMTGEGQ